MGCLRRILVIDHIQGPEGFRADQEVVGKPYKLKQGFIDFWVPTYLYIKKQDYSLYGANGAYIPNINMEFFELLQKHPAEYLVKAFDVTGVKVEIFNQYRKFLNVEAIGSIKSDDFIETIKPFFSSITSD